VIDHLPEFRMSDPWVTKEFTITDTMAQRSGLADHWGSDLSVLGYNRTEMIRAQQYAEPVASFRSQYMYQNVMFLVPAAIVEKKSGRAWEDDVKERIFTPLGMTKSTTTLAGFRSAQDKITLHMIGVHDDGTVGAVALPPDWPIADFGERIGPAGGIGSTANDMARWAIFQLGNGTDEGRQLISPANMNFMHSPKTPMGQNMDTKQYYAQGWIYQEMQKSSAIVWHNGETLGSHAMVLLVPRENLGIVVLGNMAGGMSLPDQLATQFYLDYFGVTGIDLCNATLPAYRETLSQALIQKEPPASPVPALPLSQYTGTYTSKVYGPAVVTEQNGTLRLAMGKRPVNLILTHWDGNTFRWTAPEIGKSVIGFATFDVDASGTPVRVTSDLFIESSYGAKATFARE
jgi:CubicO group peptidase (beta-lactamase class C family)